MRLFELRYILSLAIHREYARYAARYVRSRRRDHLIREPEPWLVFAAIDFLDGLDLRGKRIFEYGSGGSTLYWLQRGASCVSIEHDPAWYARIQGLLGTTTRADYRLIEPTLGNPDAADPADPDAYASSHAAYRGMNFRDYCAQTDAFPDESFDVVLIDGRARTSCIKHAAAKVRQGGLLIIDNSERAWYFERTAQFLAGFDRRDFHGPVPSTPTLATTAILVRQELLHA